MLFFFLADCVVQFELMTLRRQQKAHPQVRALFLDPAGVAEIGAALVTGQIQDNSLLDHTRCRMQFGRSNEVSIEEKHARANKAIAKAPHHGPAFIASHSRKQCLQQKLSDPV